jgi:hypothetical protein
VHEILDNKEVAIEAYRAAIDADKEHNSGLSADIERLARRLASS